MMVGYKQASYQLILMYGIAHLMAETLCDSFFPPLQVQPFLPQWLAQPKLLQKRIKENLIPVGDVPGIHPKLLKKLQMNGIDSFFPGTLIVLFLSEFASVVPESVAVCFMWSMK